MKRTILISALTALLVLSAASPAASTQELGLNKAKAATARYAAEQCQKNPQCVKSDARYCDRQNDLKLICDAFNILRRGIERVQCRQQIVVSAQPGSGQLRLNPRAPRCDG